MTTAIPPAIGDAMKAQLKWVLSTEGGRARLPSGERYVTIAQLVNPTVGTRGEEIGDWSMLILSSPSPREQGTSTSCDVSFLSPGAPHHELASGVKFRLLEGAKIVANGVIL